MSQDVVGMNIVIFRLLMADKLPIMFMRRVMHNCSCGLSQTSQHILSINNGTESHSRGWIVWQSFIVLKVETLYAIIID